MWVNYLAEFGYLLFPVVSILGLYHVHLWLQAGVTDPCVRGFIIAFGLIMAAVLIRVGWFSASRYLANSPDVINTCVPAVQNLWFWTHKEIAGAIAGVIYLSGGLLMYQVIDGKSRSEVAWAAGLILIIAMIVAIL
jgi:hypothetical protein